MKSRSLTPRLHLVTNRNFREGRVYRCVKRTDDIISRWMNCVAWKDNSRTYAVTIMGESSSTGGNNLFFNDSFLFQEIELPYTVNYFESSGFELKKVTKIFEKTT